MCHMVLSCRGPDPVEGGLRPARCEGGAALREGEAGRLDWPRAARACRRHLIQSRRSHRPRSPRAGRRTQPRRCGSHVVAGTRRL